MLSDIDVEKREFVSKVVKDLSTLSDLLIEHAWYDENDAQTHLFLGKLLSTKSRAEIPNLTVGYWSLEETFDDAVDYKMTVVQLLADFLTGDVSLVT